LKPTHGLFGYFTALIESYQRVLNPRKDQVEKLQRFTLEQETILRQAGERYLWDRYQEEEAKKREEGGAALKNGQAAQDEEMQIDWHDFVVVEKIDLYDDEEMRAIEEQEQHEAALLQAEQARQ
jgi:splicing factor 3A subunit 1